MRTSTTLSCAVTYADIDYHKKFSVVTLGDSAGKVVSTQRIPNDEHAIKEFFADYKNIQCAVESCRGYEWFVDLLKEIGQTVQVANPYELALIARSRCKTEKVDSRILMELLAMGFLPICDQPTAAERKLRERLRWRCHLVRNTTRIKVRIHSLLDNDNLGLRLGSTIFKGEGRKLLEKIELKAPGRQELLKKHLEHFERLVESENSWVIKTAKSNPDAQLLMTITGIAEFSALLILAELGRIDRFTRSAQVVNFAGLAPTIRQSASSTFIGSITKQGPPMSRWILVQDAWQAIRRRPQLRFFYLTVSRRGGRHGAIIATAGDCLPRTQRSKAIQCRSCRQTNG